MKLSSNNLFLHHHTIKFSGDAASTLLDGILAYYKLDEASSPRVDSIGSNDLTKLLSVDPGNNTGKVGSCADFTSNTILKGSPLDIPGDFTIACWVNFQSDVGVNGILGSFDDNTGNHKAFYLSAPSSLTPQWYVNPDGGVFTGTILNYGSSVSTGIWYFFTCWLDTTNNTINLRVNNDTANEVSTSYTGGVYNNMTVWEMGTYDSNLARAFQGCLDEVGVWTRVLTDEEITELYNGGSGLTYPFN